MKNIKIFNLKKHAKSMNIRLFRLILQFSYQQNHKINQYQYSAF